MAFSKSMALRFYLRVCLFFPVPLYASIFWTDSTLLITLTLTSLVAVPLHFVWMRKRFGPFLAFLSCVYAFQMVICLGIFQLRLAAHHTIEAVRPDTPIETISIVITAHNEHQYIERTIDSILETTPPEILMEIIVIDDGSNPPLELKYEKLHMLRHDERRGLVKSKMEGGNAAKADMIMFLDAHVKPTNGDLAKRLLCTSLGERFVRHVKDGIFLVCWYKGLLRHLNINYKRVVVPLIPILNGALHSQTQVLRFSTVQDLQFMRRTSKQGLARRGTTDPAILKLDPRYRQRPPSLRQWLLHGGFSAYFGEWKRRPYCCSFLPTLENGRGPRALH
eukprot:symbB.v1.2.030569.t1/scaffold3462.1/size56284/1